MMITIVGLYFVMTREMWHVMLWHLCNFFPHGAYDDKRKSMRIALSDRRKRMAAGTVLVNVTRGNVFSEFHFCNDFKPAVKKLGGEKIWAPENKIHSSFALIGTAWQCSWCPCLESLSLIISTGASIRCLLASGDGRDESIRACAQPFFPILSHMNALYTW